MISKLIRFTLCFALFYSAQSAAYNEAMCILIKQEMQQNSNNKASQKYRKAARDYKNNCNKPKEIQAQPKPQIIEPEPAIITQPQPKIVEPAPVIKPTEEAVKESINEQTLNLTNDQKQQINDQLNTNSNEIVIDAEPIKVATEQVITEQKNEDVIEQIKPATPEQSATPAPIKATSEKPTPVKPAPVLTKPAPVIAPQPVAQSPSSLLLPTLILVIVVLIGAMIVVRLRRAKQSKAMAEAVDAEPAEISKVTQVDKIVESNIAANKESEPTDMAQNVDVDVDTDIKSTATPSTNEPHTVTTQVQTSENEPTPLDSTPLNPTDISEQASGATFNKVKQKPEPNTAEFEAAAKTTLERIKNASSFNEPEVRDFDPDAKPVKKQRKHYTAQVAESAPIEAEHNTVEPLISTPEPVTAREPVVDLHTPEQISDAQSTLYTTEQDFKEPEVRTFNPDAPLPGEKPMPKKQSAPEQVQATLQVDEPQNEPKKADSSNPFANLSLDSSWDPDSTEKPKIEEKKRAPKSQSLIDAEERAKNMQTKE